MPSLTTQVREVAAHLLPDGASTGPEVARALGLSTRLFQLELEKESTTYQKILQTTRQLLAETYLAEGQLPIEWIAKLLGFTHTSGFSRAFRRSPGTTAQGYAARRIRTEAVGDPGTNGSR